MSRPLVAIVATAVAASGCMTTYAARVDPGPHDSVISILGLGAIGDAGLAAGASAITAATTDERGDTFDYFWPFAAGIAFVDVLIALAIIQARFSD
jgi:hypothetical protein